MEHSWLGLGFLILISYIPSSILISQSLWSLLPFTTQLWCFYLTQCTPSLSSSFQDQWASSMLTSFPRVFVKVLNHVSCTSVSISINSPLTSFILPLLCHPLLTQHPLLLFQFPTCGPDTAAPFPPLGRPSTPLTRLYCDSARITGLEKRKREILEVARTSHVVLSRQRPLPCL